jgi:hypothetical protein
LWSQVEVEEAELNLEVLIMVLAAVVEQVVLELVLDYL